MLQQKKPKYVTKKINEKLDVEIQALLWMLMDILSRKRKDKMDHLQIFNIATTNKHIKIINRQEHPYFEEEFVFAKDSIVNENSTVWIIDEPDKQIMLFPRDY
jgi:hypothetical protein